MDRGLHHPGHRATGSRHALDVTGLVAALLLLGGCAATEPAYAPVPTRDASVDDRVAAVEGRLGEMSQRLDQVGGQVQRLEAG